MILIQKKNRNQPVKILLILILTSMMMILRVKKKGNLKEEMGHLCTPQTKQVESKAKLLIQMRKKRIKN